MSSFVFVCLWLYVYVCLSVCVSVFVCLYLSACTFVCLLLSYLRTAFPTQRTILYLNTGVSVPMFYLFRWAGGHCLQYAKASVIEFNIFSCYRCRETL